MDLLENSSSLILDKYVLTFYGRLEPPIGRGEFSFT